MPKKPNPFLIDDDNPEWTAADFKRARPLREADPKLYKAWKKAQEEGRPFVVEAVEDAQDLAAVAAHRVAKAKGKIASIPSEMVDRMLAGENLVRFKGASKGGPAPAAPERQRGETGNRRKRDPKGRDERSIRSPRRSSK